MSTEKNSLGKFDRNQFKQFVLPHLGANSDMEVKPEFGSDFTALRIGEGKVITVSTDPLSISRKLGWKKSGKLALQVVACDVATSGISPDYVIPNWNLPVDFSDRDFEEVWSAFCREARRENITVIGGHTGRYQGPGLPITGAATVFGVGNQTDLLNGEVNPGDLLASFGTPGLEAAGIFSFYFPEKVKKLVGEDGLASLREKYDGIRPTKSLNTLASIDGVKKLHDLGEGGLIGGAQELLESSDPGIRLSVDEITLPCEVRAIPSGLDLDPLKITSTGAGLAVLEKGKLEEVSSRARKENINLTRIGKFTEKKGLEVVEEETKILKEPVHDSFWDRLKELSS